MKRTTRFAIPVLLLVLLCGTGCRRIVDTFTGEKVLAQVDGSKLYLSDISSIFTPGTTPEDSVKLLESYIDMWVKKQLKTQEAERRFSQSVPEIDRMVEEYRNSLLGFRLDTYFVEQKLDTLVTQEQIREYYDANRAEFVLDRTIVRGRVVKLPDNYRQKSKLKELFKWVTQTQKQDFMDICQKNNFEVSDFSAWTDYPAFLAKLPSPGDSEKALVTPGVQEARAGGASYFFVITEVRRQGDAMPVERAQAVITQSIMNGRRANIIRAYEDSLYNAAVKEKQIVINVE